MPLAESRILTTRPSNGAAAGVKKNATDVPPTAVALQRPSRNSHCWCLSTEEALVDAGRTILYRICSAQVSVEAGGREKTVLALEENRLRAVPDISKRHLPGLGALRSAIVVSSFFDHVRSTNSF